MFVFSAILKGIIISVLLLLGCVLLGKAINKRFSPTIAHYLVMFVITLVTCILIVFYSLTSSLKSTVEKYGSLVVDITTLPANINLETLTSNVTDIEDYIESVSKVIGNEYPLISDLIQKVTKSNKKLQFQINAILASNSADKTVQIINSVTTSAYQGIIDKFFWVKFKLFMGIVFVQLILIVMMLSVTNKKPITISRSTHLTYTDHRARTRRYNYNKNSKHY